MTMSTEDTAELIQHAAEGDQAAGEGLFSRHRQRLHRVIALRIDGPLRRRIDASDVLQDVYLGASRRLDDYRQRRPCPFFLWLRMIAGERLIVAYRKHLGAQKRDVGREVPLDAHGVPHVEASSIVIQLQSAITTPSGVAMRRETEQQIRTVLDAMSNEDREVLVLRHFEHLSNRESAHVLGINPSTASTRYVRALKRLQSELVQIPGFGGEG